MSLAESLGFAVLLIGVVMYASKMAIEGEPIDVLTLAALCIAVGYMGHKL